MVSKEIISAYWEKQEAYPGETRRKGIKIKINSLFQWSFCLKMKDNGLFTVVKPQAQQELKILGSLLSNMKDETYSTKKTS